GADIALPSNDGSTPFYSAACHGHLDVVKWFVERDAELDLEQKNNDGWTPLNAAACKGYLDVVQYLVEHG
ncbi:ankyrin, partial [Ophiobolus disseminans]